MKVKIIDIVLKNGYTTQISFDENEKEFNNIKDIFTPNSIVSIRTINREIIINTDDISLIDCNIVDLDNPEDINNLKNNKPITNEKSFINKKSNNSKNLNDMELIIIDNEDQLEEGDK